MPAFPIFTAAINQASNTTFGWTSKALYVYQAGPDGTKVFEDADVFNAISSDGYWYKGNSLFKSGYFNTPNVNQGRAIKITMYFFMDFLGQTIEMQTGFKEQSTGDTYFINAANSVEVGTESGSSYCKYECYLNVYDTGANIDLQATGQAIIQADSAGRVRTMAINGKTTLTPGLFTDYNLNIINKTGFPIFISNLLIEEIG